MSRKHRQRGKNDKTVYQSLVLITQFGINMLVPICMMSALGVWLDHKFQTPYWTILLFFVGAIAGGQNVYRMAKAVYAPDKKEKAEEKTEDGLHGDIEKQK